MKHKLSILLLVLALGLGACAPASQDDSAAPGGTRAWFDAPLPGTVFYPPSPICQIIAHGAAPGGISSFELSINGAVSSIPSPDTQSSLVTLSRDCGLSQPGEYLLRLRAQDHQGNWSEYAETSLVIAAGETQTPGTPAGQAGTTVTATSTSTATATPTAAPAGGGVTIESLSSDFIYIGRSSCGPLEVTITARATAPNGIKVVVLFYRFEYGEGPAGFESVAMNPQGGDLYRITLNPTSLLHGVPFEQATLQYQVVIQQNNGDLTLRTPVLADISVKACGPVDTARATPVVSCSSYTDKRTCQAKGCNWVSIPGTVPLFACRAP